MTAKDLKNALLQEAVQGKLVPQIASEGNARDLLEEIRKEKAKLVKEGKIKKEKTLPKITEEEIPFDIPEYWCWCRLGEIVQLISGQDLQPEMYNSSKKGIPYITGASNFNNGQILINRWTENPKSIAIKDDLLLTCKGTVGEMAFLKEKQVHIARQVMSIRSSEKISLGYVKLYLTTQIEGLKSKAKSMIPGIAREDVMSSLISLPPLAEQKRIVAAIEKFMPLIEEYGKKETELKALNEQIGTLTKKAILQEAVQGKLVPQISAEGNAKDLLEEINKEKTKFIKEGKIKKEKPLPEISEDEIPYDIPENWCWCRLEELGITNTGTTPSKSEGKYFGNYIDFLSPGDLDGAIVTYGNQGLSEEGYKVARPTPKGTIIQVCIGGSIGKCAIVDREVTFNQQINSISPIKLNSDYIYYTISSDFFYKNIRESATGTATPIINKSNWERLLIPLPPLAEQKRIVAAIEKLLPLCEKFGE